MFATFDLASAAALAGACDYTEKGMKSKLSMQVDDI
jgi:hypothetical protein